METINKAKSSFFEIINKVDKPLAIIISKKNNKYQYQKIFTKRSLYTLEIL